MTGATFDTLAYTRRLKEAGLDAALAEAQADALRDAFTEGAATKTDIDGLKTDHARLEGKIDVVKAEVKNLKWYACLAAGIAVALIKLLP